MEFLQNLDTLHQVFWYIAIPVSVVFIIQAILTFIGIDSSDGVEADFDGDFDGDAPFQLFSLRNLVNFLIGFSWTGVLLYGNFENKTILIFTALVVGVVFVVFFFFLMRQILKLSEDNTFRIENTIGRSGNVYLTIPEFKSGKGKIQVSVKGTIHELDAMTEQETILSGSIVRVKAVESGNLVIVEKL
jgi:membrane protein implicated in regulation of membrane protease activity